MNFSQLSYYMESSWERPNHSILGCCYYLNLAEMDQKPGCAGTLDVTVEAHCQSGGLMHYHHFNDCLFLA
jgi:hypothetical protein